MHTIGIPDTLTHFRAKLLWLEITTFYHLGRGTGFPLPLSVGTHYQDTTDSQAATYYSASETACQTKSTAETLPAL